MEGQELPVGWTSYCLSDVGGTKGGKTPSKSRSEFWHPATINWTSPKDMKAFELRGSEDMISELAVCDGGMEVLPAGSVLMVTRSGILSHTFPVAIAREETVINQDIKAIKPIDGLDERFLAYTLKSLESTVLGSCSKEGTTVASVETKLLERLLLPLAPLNEQRRIAAKLDTTLAAVEACRQRLDGVAAILKRFRQAVLAAATSGELTREWRESSAEPEWDTKAMGECGAVTGGITKNSTRTGLALQKHYLRVANVYHNHLELDDLAVIGVTESEYTKTVLRGGDLLIVEGNGSLQQVGRVAIWEESGLDCVHQNHLIRWRSLGMRPRWALYWLMSPVGRDLLEQRAKSTTGLHTLSVKKISSLPIPVPSLSEQNEIINRVEALFSLAYQLEAKLTAARKVVDRLMPALLAKAFRGELVPQDPNDEPASVLLERIRAAREAEAAAGKPSRRGRRQAAAHPGPAARPAAPAPPDHLVQLLQECGALSERALLAASELDPAGFRAQLALEQGLGVIRETAQDGQVLLEAVG